MKVIVKFAVYNRKDHPQWQKHYRIVCDTGTQKAGYCIQYYDQNTHEWYYSGPIGYETLELLYKSKEFRKLFNVI